MCHLSAIADNVLVVLVAIEAVWLAIVVLSLPSRGREEALFAFPTTSHTRWLMGIVNASHVTLDLPTPTWYARLIDAFMLRWSLWLLRRRRAIGAIGAFRMQWILRRRG